VFDVCVVMLLYDPCCDVNFDRTQYPDMHKQLLFRLRHTIWFTLCIIQLFFAAFK